MSQFSPPASGGGPSPADVSGHLLLIAPISYEPAIPTSFGETDAVRCVVVDLDAGEVWPDTMWFSRKLVGSLKLSIGAKVLARMGQGTAKPGQSPPWELIDATGDPNAVQRATKWQTAHASADLSAPAQPNPEELV